MIDLRLGDCLENPPPDCDVIITDPPYGIKFASQPTKWQRRAGMEPKYWDEKPADVSFILEMSKPTVIFGGNYFPLPLSRCWLAWTKPDAPPSMGNLELAWTNFDKPSKFILHSIAATNAERVGHPTQKPLRVMKWVIENYTKEGDVIFDPYAGSGTTAVACIELRRDFIGYEVNPEYHTMAMKRIAAAQQQMVMSL